MVNQMVNKILFKKGTTFENNNNNNSLGMEKY